MVNLISHMKYSFTVLLFLILTHTAFSQTAPARMNYQGLARSATGLPFANQPIGLQFRILQGAVNGPPVFTETHTLTTNALGLFNTQIGINGNLGGVNWASGSYFLEVSIDTAGSTNYFLLGTQEIVSVPYALYAASAPSPSVSITNNVLTVGSNSVPLPPGTSSSVGGTTLTGSGAIITTSTGLNTYDINTPSVTLTGGTTILGNPLPAGIAQIFGSFPNYSICVTPTVTYANATGLLHFDSYPFTSPVYSYTADITQVLSISGNVLTVGPVSNSVTIPSSGAPTPVNLARGGAVTTTTLGVNSYSVSVPITSITSAGTASVFGSYPSFTIATPPTTASSPQTSLTGIGALTVTPIGTNTFDLAVPITTISAGSGITVNGSYPSFTVGATSQSVSVVANTLAGLAQVSGAYPNYTVTVAPNFNYSSTTGSLVVSNPGYPALSYSTYVTPSLSFNSGTGLLSSGPVSNSVTIPVAITPSISGKGVATVNPTSGTSFTVTVPGTSVTSANNTATITSSGTNTFDISVPARFNLSSGANTTLTGTYPNQSLNALPQTSITTSGTANATVTSAGTNTFNISVPAVTLTPSGGGITSVTGTYPNLTITSPSVALSAFSNGGLLSFFGSFPSYSLAVAPLINYSSATGSLTLTNPTTLNAFSYNITPSVTISNNVIQSGPTTNTVAIITPSAQAFAVSGSAPISIGGTTLFTTSFTKQAAASEIDVFVYTQVGTGLTVGNFTFDLLVDGNASLVSVPHVSAGSTTEYITLRAVFSGLSTGGHTVSIRAKASIASIGVTIDPNAYGGKMILKETY